MNYKLNRKIVWLERTLNNFKHAQHCSAIFVICFKMDSEQENKFINSYTQSTANSNEMKRKKTRHIMQRKSGNDVVKVKKSLTFLKITGTTEIVR